MLEVSMKAAKKENKATAVQKMKTAPTSVGKQQMTQEEMYNIMQQKLREVYCATLPVMATEKLFELSEAKKDDEKFLIDLVRESMYATLSANPYGIDKMTALSMDEAVIDIMKPYLIILEDNNGSIDLDARHYIYKLIFSKIEREMRNLSSRIYNIFMDVVYGNTVDRLLKSTDVITIKYTVTMTKNKCKEIVATGDESLSYSNDIENVYHKIDEYFEVYYELIEFFHKVIDSVLPDEPKEGDTK